MLKRVEKGVVPEEFSTDFSLEMQSPPEGAKEEFPTQKDENYALLMDKRSIFFQLQRHMDETLHLSHDPPKCLASTFRKRLVETGRPVQVTHA